MKVTKKPLDLVSSWVWELGLTLHMSRYILQEADEAADNFSPCSIDKFYQSVLAFKF